MRTCIRIITLVIILSGCFLSLRAEPSADKIRIIVPQANVYLKPNAESLVILQVRAGAILTGEKYDETWYKTALPPDKDGFVATGFLKAADIEIFSEEKPVVKEAVPPKPEKSEPVRLQPATATPISSSEQESIHATLGSTKGFFLSFHGSLSGAPKIPDSSFTRNPNYSFMSTLQDDGNIHPGIKSMIFGGEFVLGYFFSDIFGVGLSARYSPDLDISLRSSYTLTWKFTSGTTYSESQDWDSKGTASAVPLSLNVYLRLRLAARSFLALQAGPTLFLTNRVLATKTGYGVAQQSRYYIGPYLYTTTYVDWYVLDIENKLKKTSFGFNVGLEFEQRIFPNIGIVLCGGYYYAPPQSVDWTLIPASRYDGEFGNLYRTISSDKSNLPVLATIATVIKFSFPSLSFGIRFHL